MSKRKLWYDIWMNSMDDNKPKRVQEPFTPPVPVMRLKKSEEIAPISKKVTVDNLEELNHFVSELIRKAHQSSCHASPNHILSEICKKYRVSSLDHLNFKDKQLEEKGSEIPALTAHAKTLSQINFIINCCISINVISTIVDIENEVAQQLKVQSFNDLGVGPIWKFPLIIKYFDIPDNLTATLNISTGHILMNLKKFYRLSNKKSDIFSFLDYLCNVYKVKSISRLGLKIRDFSTLADVARSIEENERRLLNLQSDRISKLLIYDFEDELKKISSHAVLSHKIAYELANSKVSIGTSAISISHTASGHKMEPESVPTNNEMTLSLANVFSLIPFETFLQNYESFIRENFDDIENRDARQKVITATKFVSILRNILENGEEKNLFFQLSFFSSLKRYLDTCSPPSVSKSIEPAELPLIDIGKLSLELINFLSSSKSITLTDLIAFENNHLQQYKVSVLNLISDTPKFGSFINFSKNLSCTVSKSIYKHLIKWRGTVPQKWAEAQLLRNFNSFSLSDLKISNFPDIYSSINSCQSWGSVVNMEVFLCGYPLNKNDFYLNPQYRSQLPEILNHIDSFEEVSNSLIFTSYSDSTSCDEFMRFCHELSSLVSPNNEFLLIFFPSSSKTIYKVNIFTNPEQELVSAVTNSDSRLAASILISQLLSLAQHWDSSIYSLLISWLSNAFRTLESINPYSIANFIVGITSFLEDRLASLVFAKILLPCYLMAFPDSKGYQNIWDAACSNNLCSKLLKIAVYEDIGELFMIDDYLERFKIRKSHSHHISLPEPLIESVPVIEDDSPRVKAKYRRVEIQKTENIPDDLIDSIRRDQYLYGVETADPAIQKLIGVQKDRLGRALKHLSAELYSNQYHFILEIFQNLDDAFSVSTLDNEPTVAWVILEDALIIFSNEQGFNAQDIISLCDISNSSKKNSKLIGHKGIGFKSVFQITDRPEIHSKKYHICFDYKKYGPLGFLMPESIPDNVQHINKHLKYLGKLGTYNWNTRYYLPFKQSCLNKEFSTKIFDNINVDIFLFINNIRNCVVYHHQKLLTHFFQRIKSQDMINIRQNDQNHQWIYLTRPVTHDSKSYHISIALPTPNENSSYQPLNKPQPLYCYLPLSASPFNFVLNAPFRVNSSREGIINTDELNLKLLSSVSNLFVQSIDLVQKKPSLREMWLNLVLSMLPDIKYQHDSSFDWVIRAIIRDVRKKELIKCVDGSLHKPFDSIIIPPQYKIHFDNSSELFLMDFVSFSDILGLHIVDYEFLDKITDANISKLESIGVVKCSFETFVNFIVRWYHYKKYRCYLMEPSKIGIVFGILFKFRNLSDHLSKNFAFDQIKTLEIICVGSKFVTPGSTVYFIKKSDPLSTYVGFLQNFVNIIDCELFEAAVNACSPEVYDVRAAFMEFGVQSYNHQTMFQSLVTNFYRSDYGCLDSHVNLFKYVSALLKAYPSFDLSFLIENGYVYTTDMQKWPLVSKIYLSSEVISNFKTYITCTQWPTIHDNYLTDQEASNFLFKICLLDTPKLYEVNITQPGFKDLQNLWSSCPPLANKVKEINKNHLDFTNTNLVDILIKGSFEERIFLAKFLDVYWNVHYQDVYMLSSFLLLLKEHPWLPTVCLSKSVKPSSLFNRTSRNQAFLGDDSLFLVSQYEFKNKNLIDFLKLRNEPIKSDLAEVFKYWSEQCTSTTVSHIKSIYKELELFMRIDELLIKCFETQSVPFVFVPSDKSITIKSSDSDIRISGRFVSHLDLFMDDPIFHGSYVKYPLVTQFYNTHSLTRFFGEVVKVPKKPCFDTYLMTFQNQFLPLVKTFDHSEVLRVISEIGILLLEPEFVVDTMVQSQYVCFKEMFDNIKSVISRSRSHLLNSTTRKLDCIPTDKETLVSPATKNLYICDNYFLRESFSNLADIFYFSIPNIMFSKTMFSPTREMIGLVSLAASYGVKIMSTSVVTSVDRSYSNKSMDDPVVLALMDILPHLYSYMNCLYPSFCAKYLNSRIESVYKNMDYIAHRNRSFKVFHRLNQTCISECCDCIFATVKGRMEFHFCPTSLEKTQKLDTSIVNEYLKAVLGSPSPCLIREISIFLSAFEQTPKERRSTLLTTFGLECSTFYAKLNYYYDIYKIKSIHMSDSFSLDYRVDYRNEPPLDDSSNPGSVRPVIQPVSNDADNLDVSNQSSSVDVSFTRLGNSSRSSYTDQVGRWGELVINQLLQTKKTSLDIGGEICEVQWMNENEESYLPYDFILRVKDYRNSEVRVYIEVKASANPKNPQFDLSFKEIEFAQHCKGNYHVIKVSPKNNKISGELLKEDDCNIRVYKNLIRHLNKRNIRLIAVPQ